MTNKRWQLPGRHKDKKSISKGSHSSTNQTKPTTKILIEN